MKERDTRPISIRLPKKQIEHLKYVARKLAVKRNENTSYADLIREAISKTYPMEDK